MGSQTGQGFYVDPIRSGSHPISLFYNTTTKEVVYAASISFGYGYVALTDAATITWTMTSVINNASVTLGGNRTLSLASLADGMSGTLIVTQDATGSRTLTLPANSRVVNGGGGAITLSTAANAVDILTFTYNGATNLIYWNLGKNYTGP